MTMTFDLSAPLPEPNSTIVLEASAGTGKTFALAGLVTRYLAETDTGLDEMLLITFNRAASRELRERVRNQITDVVAAQDGRPRPNSDNALVQHLTRGTADQRAVRRSRLAKALSSFDTATIATIHEFCGIVLKSLGVAGNSPADVKLEENLDPLVTEIVADVYLARFGRQDTDPPFSYDDALILARQVVGDPSANLRPEHPDPESTAKARLDFAEQVSDELERRKGELGIQGFDDLLKRLAASLEPEHSDARARMRGRWRIVLVDEFQDTDPIQWQVLERAFSGHSTLILIGDPKQAIYGFRGGDVYTYLKAAHTADRRYTLDVNWRTDQPLVDSLQTVLSGAALGHPEIVVYPVRAANTGHRLVGAPRNDPFRLRVVRRETLGYDESAKVPIDKLREHIGADLAADVATLLNSDATFDGESVTAGHIAVIVDQHKDAAVCRDALLAAGVPAVHTGDTDVFASAAADDWLCLLEAFDQPHRSGLVRAAATTMFFGHTIEDLARDGDTLTNHVADTLREWTDHTRVGEVAAVFEAAKMRGMSRRILGEQGGERQMTDLAHVAELLQDAAHRERLGLPGLRHWLREQREDAQRTSERNRRLDSDAAAVQIMTVFVAKGLQFPIVYLPFMFRRFVRRDDILLFHEDDGTRCLYIGGDGLDRRRVEQLNRQETARDNTRSTYVALTRAQSQLVAWWAPSGDEVAGGLSRLLRGRTVGQAEVPDRCAAITDTEARAVFGVWQSLGGPAVEDSVCEAVTARAAPASASEFAVRHFHRRIDTDWQRTSYSALVRRAGETEVRSEPETPVRDDEPDEITVVGSAQVEGVDTPSPMAGLPSGKVFGSLVHAVLETADPFATDLAGELAEQVRRHEPWWPLDVEAATLAAAMLPMHDTPLGPLADGQTLRRIGVRDRLRELDFEIPLVGGDAAGPAPEVRLSDVGSLLDEHLASTDPFAPYAERLTSNTLGSQPLRGYLSGSLDVVLRLAGPRYLVVDYKTNNLGDTAADYGSDRLTEAMLHSDYPLQALLYVAVLHRFLRWRQPGYHPERHLGGVLYLFVRGMCGADTPVVDEHPAGVFSWRPPAALVVGLSDLLNGERR